MQTSDIYLHKIQIISLRNCLLHVDNLRQEIQSK